MSTLTILMIDDNIDDIDNYTRTLKKVEGTHYCCVEAKDGTSGLKLLNNSACDCVLLDYSLPGANGVQVLQDIRAKYPFLPVIMLTGQGNENVAVQAIKLGAHHYLTKTLITPDLLSRTIREAIDRGMLEKTVAEKDQQLLQKTKDLEESVAKLIESNAELERFAYVASHDMQEPIRMVTNFSQIIASDYQHLLDENAREYLGLVIESGNRIREMIEDLLDYSRMGDSATRISSFDGESALESALENISTLISDKEATITHDPLPEIHGNPVQFMRLMQNLICNGIKYQKEGVKPRIHIAVKDTSTHWHISIEDNGIGIKEEFIKQIFEPFRRLHTYHDIQGTGLGLAICRKIVEMHGGKIWATSTPDEGSIFHFTLSKKVPQAKEHVA